MEAKERLNVFIKSLELKPAQFEKKVGLSNGYINNIRKSIGEDVINKILTHYPQLNKIWLLHGEGQMLKSTGYTMPEADSSKNLVNDSDMNDVYANHKQKALANESATTDLQPLTMQAILKLVDNTHMLASANKTLVETNSRLANRVLAEPGHAPEQTQSIFETKSREILELLSQALVDGKKYKTVEEADAYVHNMLFGKPKKIASEGIQNG